MIAAALLALAVATGPVPAEAAAVNATAAAPPVPVPARLQAIRLRIPVEGVQADVLVDTFTDARSAGRSHDAIDIMAPHGTPVHAVDDGEVVKLFDSVPGGLTVYQFDPTREVAYYYAHLERRADGLHEGQVLRRGELVGYVGSTGNADPAAPHLHFAVFVLGPEKRWWEGEALNPFPLFTRPMPEP